MANKKKLLKLLLMPLALIAAKGHAELVEVSYITPTGSQKVQLVTTTNYINAANTLKFKLSAGIDRKVQATILDSSGSQVAKVASPLLGASDRITTSDGKSYYGAELPISTLPEGNYSVKADILAADGSVVQTSSYPIVVDVTPPAADPITTGPGGYSMTISGSTWLLGRGGVEDQTFYFNNINDLSGISSVVAKTYRSDGTLYATKTVGYNSVTKLASISTETSGLVPANEDLNELLKLQVLITDSAGNVTTKEQLFKYDNYIGTASLVGVFDPDSSNVLVPGLTGFVPYVSGMTVKTNPIKLVFKIAKSNYYKYNPGGLKMINGLGTTNDTVEDTDSVYIVTTSPYGNTDGNYWRWDNFGQYGGGGISYNLVLSPTATPSPKLLGVQYNYSDIGWASYSRVILSNTLLPLTISGIKVLAEARTYDQVATFDGTCTIPAGDTSCTIAYTKTLQPGTTGYLHDNAVIWDKAHTLMSNPSWADLDWNDQYYPQITYTYDAAAQSVTQYVVQPGRGNYFDRLALKTVWLENAANNNAKIAINPTKLSESGTNYSYKWDLTQLPEGNYNLVAVAQENHGPTTRLPLFSLTKDKTPPTIDITTTSSSNQVASLDDISINVSDTVTDIPTVTSVNLKGGPAKENVYLTVRQTDKNKYKLEYPVMFPSLKAGEEYTLAISAKDDQGNTTTKSMTFTYSPRQVTLAGGMDGKILVPNVQRSFKRADGNEVISTDPLTLNDGSVVSGNYDVYVTLRSDAQYPVVINGVTVQPGQTTTVAKQMNFSVSGGRINLPAYPANNTIGTASLLISTSAPNAPVLVVDLNSWAAVAQLSAQTWEVRQVIDTLNISATPATGTACRLTSDASIAQVADSVKDPVCLLEWASKPDETTQTIKSGDSLKVAGLVGQAVAVGVQPVAYTLSLYSGGEKIVVGTGSRDLTVKSAVGEVAYNPPAESLTVNRIIGSVSIAMKQTKGPDCSLTLDGDTARKMATNQDYASTSRTCLFEYTNIPDGLTQDNYSNTPLLKGTLINKASYPLAWRVSVFSKSGTRITLNEQTANIEAVDPPAPVIDLDTKYRLNGDASSNTLVVPMAAGTYLGDTNVTSALADLDVAINRGADTLESETYPAGYGDTQKISRRITTDERKLWESVVYSVTAKYNKVPDVSSTAQYTAVSVPSDSILPAVTTESATAVNTKALPVTVKIRDQYKPDAGYNAETMGQWKVRLLRQGTYGVLTPLSDYMDATDGVATFNVDLTNVDGTSLRILAEASLVSPLNGYTRVVQSRSPAYLQLLRGNSIGASTVTRKLSGPAPFRPLFKLELQNRLDSGALGQVKWQVSSDKGASWVDYIPSANYKMTYQQTFDVGEYLVRAETTNSNSGALEYTENVQVVAYKMPDIQIDGPSPLFIGDTGKYSLSTAPSKYGQAVTDYVENENIVEWSTDSGKNFTLTAPTITLTQSEAGNIPLVVRVRSKNAPESDDAAWTVVRKNVQFAKVKAPNASIKGPTRVETGKTYTYSVKVSEPYPGMTNALKGYWTLPDGSQVNGTEMTYSPTADDLNTGRLEVSYTAWVDGFRDKGAETTTNARAGVWEYIWPKFALYDVKTATVAPADIVFTIKAVGFSGKLDNPVYTWTIPSGLIVTDKRVANIRSVTAKTPGSYTVSVKISDDRGNTSEQTSSFVIAEPTPYNVGVKYSMSNPEQREPLDLLLSGLISGGHPLDRVTERAYFVDGEKVDSSGEYGRVTLNSGTHEVKLAIKSEMGKEASGAVQVVVAANKLPVCKTKSRETVGSIIVYADCTDPDGRIKGYEWTVNGEILSSSGDRITLNKDTSAPVPTVSLVGIDDAGGRSEPVSLQ